MLYVNRKKLLIIQPDFSCDECLLVVAQVVTSDNDKVTFEMNLIN